ncbi:MAG TPA: phosphoenolpyruvate--protein phosphotransferase [Gammaproteobacteria bacterium]|nr:phosphoenolpyruvate--protein phosphotransferase [Gammaproteobacteria bacterium]
MLTLHGAGIGSGIAIGQALILDHSLRELPEFNISKDEADAEVDRFIKAIESTKHQILRVQSELPAGSPSELATFIHAHLLILQDPVISQAPIATIRERLINAEQALKIHANALIEVFDQMEDTYLRSKKADIEQIIRRIEGELMMEPDETRERVAEGLEGKVVVTHDLTPSDTVLFRDRQMNGFITNLGGPISHTAILARSLKIPAIVGLHEATRFVGNGEMLIVDGKRGVLIVDPSEEILQEYHQRKRRIRRRREVLETLRAQPGRTRDNQSVELQVNIDLPDNLPTIKKCGSKAVGLFRTEFIYMNREQPPSEEEQFQAYVNIVKTLKQPITIRTLDLGVDKQASNGSMLENVTNPALGMRAIRLCLNNPELFLPQLRAILKASAFGPVAIMIPMLSSLDELEQVLELILEIKTEFRRKGIPFDTEIPIGGMIEVPAAAVAADLFARHLDFLSIGTNDLIQYTLAIDRIDDRVNYLYDPLHPAVLRLINGILKAGKSAGIPVSMCGEMAGDTNYTRLLLGMGLRIFSMEPARLMEVKKIILDSDTRKLEKSASNILQCSTTQQIREMVDQLNTTTKH